MTTQKIIRAMPVEGDYCQELHVFGDSICCNHLDESGGAMNPRCKKYDTKLSWNISGHIHKCVTCLAQR